MDTFNTSWFYSEGQFLRYDDAIENLIVTFLGAFSEKKVRRISVLAEIVGLAGRIGANADSPHTKALVYTTSGSFVTSGFSAGSIIG